MQAQGRRLGCLAVLVSIVLIAPHAGGTAEQSSPESTDFIRIVENPVGYKLTSSAVMRKTYRYIADSELKVSKQPQLRFHLVGSTGSNCLGHADRGLEGGFATNSVSCVETTKCDVVHAWLPDGHPQFFVPVMTRVLARCNELALTKARFNAISERAVGKAVDWRYDEAERRQRQ